MNLSVQVDEFRRRAANFVPRSDHDARILAMYSAGIALADQEAQKLLVRLAQARELKRAALTEIVLQSYLFMGFPRMLVAAEVLDGMYKEEVSAHPAATVTAEEVAHWYERGLDLCRRVYDGNYEKLKNRVESIAPEIFRWMILEGYGKVLSRPELGIVDRELAIVACLMMENRPPQLFSHMRGALNVGAKPGLIRLVVDDVGDAAGDGYTVALDICNRLGIQ